MYLKVETPKDALNLSELLKDGNWMVLYYAEWCGHCNAMKPEWQKVVKNLQGSKSVNIADVKSDVIEQLKENPKVEGFPTIKMYSNGKEVALFEDERSASKITKFANDNASKHTTKTNNATLNKHNTKSVQPEMQQDMPVETIKESNTEIINEQKQPRQELPELAIDPAIELAKEQMQPIVINTVANTESMKRTNTPVNRNKLKDAPSPLTVEDLMTLPVNVPVPVPVVKKQEKKPEKKSIKKQPTQAIPEQQVAPNTAVPNIMNMPCSDIRKAKPCKSNPKCEFDYKLSKCVSKGTALQTTPDATEPKTPTLPSRKSVRKSVSKFSHSKHSKGHSKEQSKGKKSKARSSRKLVRGSKKVKNNNIRHSTKKVFSKLISSFDKIGNEAKRDSKILKNATEKLSI